MLSDKVALSQSSCYTHVIRLFFMIVSNKNNENCENESLLSPPLLYLHVCMNCIIFLPYILVSNAHYETLNDNEVLTTCRTSEIIIRVNIAVIHWFVGIIVLYSNSPKIMFHHNVWPFAGKISRFVTCNLKFGKISKWRIVMSQHVGVCYVYAIKLLHKMKVKIVNFLRTELFLYHASSIELRAAFQIFYWRFIYVTQQTKLNQLTYLK